MKKSPTILIVISYYLKSLKISYRFRKGRSPPPLSLALPQISKKISGLKSQKKSPTILIVISRYLVLELNIRGSTN